MSGSTGSPRCYVRPPLIWCRKECYLPQNHASFLQQIKAREMQLCHIYCCTGTAWAGHGRIVILLYKKNNYHFYSHILLRNLVSTLQRLGLAISGRTYNNEILLIFRL